MATYYNEIDPYCAQWLRNLIAKGLIADGDVDERDIQEVKADDLQGYDQCHFFAGIGGWAYAARLAGWPDDKPLWTGSCPCQPFSNAGKRKAFRDERHLWPIWFNLISQCRPDKVFGEQVESSDGIVWLDRVQSQMEGKNYAFGALVVPVASLGAPHIRHRIFFMADADKKRWHRQHLLPRPYRRDYLEIARRGEIGVLANPIEFGNRTGKIEGQGNQEDWPQVNNNCRFDELGDTQCQGLEIGPLPDGRDGIIRIKGSAAFQAGVVGNAWQDADLILCADERDGMPEWKWRPVEPRSFPLVNGFPGRVEQVRAYGNAINPHVAAEIIRAVL